MFCSNNFKLVNGVIIKSFITQRSVTVVVKMNCDLNFELRFETIELIKFINFNFLKIARYYITHSNIFWGLYYFKLLFFSHNAANKKFHLLFL